MKKEKMKREIYRSKILTKFLSSEATKKLDMLYDRNLYEKQHLRKDNKLKIQMQWLNQYLQGASYRDIAKRYNFSHENIRLGVGHAAIIVLQEALKKEEYNINKKNE